MTKRIRSDRRPLDGRPVSLMNPDAPDDRSRYQQVSRQFSQEFPQMAWSLGQQPCTSWCLSPRNSGRQENKNTAPADEDVDDTTADSSTLRESDYDTEFVTLGNHNSSVYKEEACINALSIAMTTAASPPDEQTDDAASLARSDAGFDPSCDLEALTWRLLWQNQIQELRYRHAMRNRNEEQVIPPEPNPRESARQRGSRGLGCVEGDRLDRIMIDLSKLGSRLRENAREQLGVISEDNAALPLCL